MQFPKSQLFEICLMQAVKKHPVLYDRDSAGYSNKKDIDGAWEEVCAEVKKKVNDVNVTHCKLRWRSLRDRYVKQFVKTRNGAIVEPDLSKWSYNTQLSFLRQHLKKRKTGEENPTSPKKRRIQPDTMLGKFKNSPPPKGTIIFESITKQNESFSDNSSIYEQDIQVEIDSLDGYECPMESAEVAEIEFVPTKQKCKTETIETMPEKHQIVSIENPIPEVSNEVILDVDDSVDQNIEHNEIIENFQSLEPLADATSIADDAATVEQQSYALQTTEECINNLLITVNNLLKDQQTKQSSNEDYFKVLDGLLKKLPADEVDKAKVDILNFVVNKTKSLNKRVVY